MYLKRPVGQSQFSVQLASQGVTHRDIQAVQSWVLKNLAEPMPLSALAARAAMSERHFRCVFVQETGQTPSAFADAARLEGVRRLLESTSQPQASLPLKTVAARVGMGSEQALRQLFAASGDHAAGVSGEVWGAGAAVSSGCCYDERRQQETERIHEA
jgi:transcriptional regulator GlxA family with amidase domain